MSIMFCCPRCGKKYEVDDQLAGKRARCKQCAETMSVPVPTRSAATPRAADVYGLDEGPAAPLPPRGGYTSSASYDDAPIPPVRRKKKKSVGFFASGSRQKKGSGNTGNAVAGIAVAVIIGVVLIAGRLAITGGELFGLSGKAEVERLMKADIATIHELTAIFKTITDEPTAIAAAPRAVDAINKMVRRYREALNKKALQRDIDDVKNRYADKMQAATQEWKSEAARVGSIPGASQHMQILEGPLQELATLLPPELQVRRQMAMMPSMPPPPPMPPAGVPQPMPGGFGQPPSGFPPGMGPAPNNGGFPGPPGMPRPPRFGPRSGPR